MHTHRHTQCVSSARDAGMIQTTQQLICEACRCRRILRACSSSQNRQIYDCVLGPVVVNFTHSLHAHKLLQFTLARSLLPLLLLLLAPMPHAAANKHFLINKRRKCEPAINYDIKGRRARAPFLIALMAFRTGRATKIIE